MWSRCEVPASCKRFPNSIGERGNDEQVREQYDAPRPTPHMKSPVLLRVLATSTLFGDGVPVYDRCGPVMVDR